MTDETKAIAPATEAINVGALLAQAIDKGIDVGALERLVALQERVLEKQAAMDFNAALANFQAEAPEVEHDSKVVINNTVRNTYASLEHIREVVQPYMAKHGLSATFPDADISDGMLLVTCVIRHSGGHSETTKAPPMPFSRASSGMNDQQAMGSAMKYAQRYALCAALGISTGERDDDAQAAGGGPISEAQAADLRVLAEEVGADVPKFLAWLGVESFEAIPEGRYRAAEQALERKRERGE